MIALLSVRSQCWNRVELYLTWLFVPEPRDVYDRSDIGTRIVLILQQF